MLSKLFVIAGLVGQSTALSTLRGSSMSPHIKTADKTPDSTTNEDVKLAKIKGSTAEVPYWNSYVKDDGLSYVAQCKFSNFSDASFGKGLQPNWLNWLPVGNLKPLLTVMPVGFYNAGHTSPNPVQLTIVLSGKVQWTFSSGQKIVFSPGQLFLEEEHLAKVGHETENVGDTPAVVLVMAATEITDSFVRDQHQPCRFPQAIAGYWTALQEAAPNQPDQGTQK